MATKRTILVVDNESDQLTMMEEILGRIGYDARTTDSPRMALKMVETQAFELIIIDLIMSDIDGTDLCEQIKQIRPSARVFAFSGHAHLYGAERLDRAGFDGTINKPATLEEIEVALNRATAAQPDS
jgi:CheY-like chemotaxis protein